MDGHAAACLIRLRSRTDGDQDAGLPDEVPMHRRRPDVDRGLVHVTHYACAPDADIAGAVHQVNAMTRTLAIVAIVLASTLAPAHALTTREWQGACESPDLGQQRFAPPTPPACSTP
jgi:hypothetical protein